MRWKKNVINVKIGKFFINYSLCSVHFEKHSCLDNDLIIFPSKLFFQSKNYKNFTMNDDCNEIKVLCDEQICKNQMKEICEKCNKR
jgi:hypothetical protein